MKSAVPLTLCESSNIRAYGYQPDGQILEVQFKTGTSYQYNGVPPELYEDFKGCPSMGRFLSGEDPGQVRHREGGARRAAGDRGRSGVSWIEPQADAILGGIQGRCRTVGEDVPIKVRRRAQGRMAYARNREERRAYARAYYHAKRKAKARAYREANRDHIRVQKRAAARARYWKDPDKFRAVARERARLYSKRKKENGRSL